MKISTECTLPDYNPPSEEIKNILEKCKKIAVVVTSPKPHRDSNRVARYLMEQGYEIIPVNPGQKTILGRPCYKTLKDIPSPIDMVDLFINPVRVPPVVDQAIDMGIRVIWMQLGVVHNQAAEKARKCGIQVVMNKCTMAEHKNLSRRKQLA
ncbi:MAG TPA: CoA-binding protein [Desulfobacteraceae bacterium]|nr:CoA-binding protein [Desulfobacteraceae bacterium]